MDEGRLDHVYLLFVMQVSRRRVHLAECTMNSTADWMKQIGRNLTDPFDGFLQKVRYLLLDRDGKFCPEFLAMLKHEGVNGVRLPPRSPNLTPHVERFMRSIKEECLGRMIFFGEQSLREAINAFREHYHQERNHQGLENRLIEPGKAVGGCDGEVIRRERLGGMPRYYYRRAA